jgi:hypothetical protein
MWYATWQSRWELAKNHGDLRFGERSNEYS